MQVEYSGWTKEHGFFSCQVFVDENKQDYELVYKNGDIAKQSTPFHEITRDWNNDGDVYTQFGAFFEVEAGHGGVFYTPVDLVRAAVDAKDKERWFFGNDIVDIPGIVVPALEKRESLDSMIEKSELRAFHQEVERNRKMDALGIRPPGEPWAR